MDDAATEGRCGSCRFWQHTGERWDGFGGPWGLCRRYPPVRLPPQGGIARLMWPITHGADDWCGEQRRN